MALLTLALVLCALVWPARAPATGAAGAVGAAGNPVDAACDTAGLDRAKASASVRLSHGGRIHTKVNARLTVHVPSSWKRAKSLLMSEDTDAYRTAMGCLTRPYESQHRWWGEWRPDGSPWVKPEKGGFEVTFDTFSWIDEATEWFALGPWKVERGVSRWGLLFEPAPGLDRVDWTKILVDPGAPGAVSAEPAPTTREGATGLVWRPKGEKAPPPVAVRVAPRWPRSFAAQDDRLLYVNVSTAGGVTWTFVACGILLYAAGKVRRRPGVTGTETQAARTVSDWAWLSAGLVIAVNGDDVLYRLAHAVANDEEWYDREQRLGLPSTLGAAVLLLAFGRPRRPILWAGAALAVPVLAVSGVPHPFGLPTSLELPSDAPDRAVYALFTAQGCLTALSLLGFTAAVWRVARDCGLVRPRRKAPHGPRELQLRYAGTAVVLSTGAIGACYAMAVERDWQRISWLSDRGQAVYGEQHLEKLREDLTWFSVNFQNWWFWYHWVITGLVILAALRAAAARATESPVAEPEDRWLFLLFFPVMVGLALGAFGNNALLESLWLVLNMATLHMVTVMARSRTVLDHTLEVTRERLGDTVTAARRRDILGRARRYREIHAMMRRLESGQSDDDILQRRLLEREVRGLHTWTSGTGTPDRLPSQVSVVDVALAMGPRDTWWGNGCRAALIACLFGLPATAVVVWSGWIRGDNWRANIHYGLGLPDLVTGLVSWQACWVGAGFVLGALWRRLPGRRGPVKALAVAVAFALPAGIDALGNFLMDQGYGDTGLDVLTMLFVLTLTGIALDLDIFRGERRFWQSRFGLLLSVYQMRYLSLQLAYLVAQAVAMVTLWQFFSDTGGGPPPKEFEGGGGAGGGGGNGGNG
ncbi:DUF6185 family protein [Streptomyces sp. Je 1-369]|uniref:DUF6185 family protein n=1 Tax=Streptomyces sp. Je 1-369 TaxID=2966192 RepID=UPI0022855E76|nr:DUF6185 family protein [Streptomyces sp. Je 1-369]WAL98715.1 DUF6185 family protein [Streptomyces sp. Je 1-369]